MLLLLLMCVVRVVDTLYLPVYNLLNETFLSLELRLNTLFCRTFIDFHPLKCDSFPKMIDWNQRKFEMMVYFAQGCNPRSKARRVSLR
jgi:hypothetical protein